MRATISVNAGIAEGTAFGFGIDVSPGSKNVR